MAQTFMQSGVAWFTEQMSQSAGRPVTFMRGSTEVQLTAWISEGIYQVTDASGVPIQITTRDYKYKTGDLSFKPRHGDRFKEVVNGETHIVEVMPQNEDPAASWVDSDGQITICHCKTITVYR